MVGGWLAFGIALDLEYCNFCSSATKIDVLQMKRQKVCLQLDQDSGLAEHRKGQGLESNQKRKAKD